MALYLIKGTSEGANNDPNENNHHCEWIACGSYDKLLAEIKLAELREVTNKLDDLRKESSGTVLYDNWHPNRSANVEAELKFLEELNIKELDPNFEKGIMLSYELVEVPLLEH